MSKRAAGALLAILPLVLAGCGGGPEASSTDTGDGSLEVEAPAWAAPLLARPGPESALVMASSDFASGDNRVAFVLVRPDGSTVRAPSLAVAYQPSDGAPVRRATARRVPLGIRASGPDDITAVYVTHLDGLAQGKRWLVVTTPKERLQGFQILDVKQASVTPAVGSPAPRSDNPTTATAPARKISTQRPPDTALLRYSIADSIAAGVPFVVAFATPQFCQTRVCGPTVDILSAARKRFAGQPVRFIHVEIYEDNNPGLGVNRWVKEWKLPSEPWVFVVDGKGIVRAKFEGAVAADEIAAAVRQVLAQG